MTGKIRESRVCYFVGHGYKLGRRKGLVLSLDDTYILIFGPEQDREKEAFLKNFKGKLLYVGEKAYNANYPRDVNDKRNTIVVFELLSLEAPFGPIDEQATV